MHLIPSYQQRSKSKQTIIARRIYNDNHCEDLRACFETTVWDNMLTTDDDINSQTDIITGYINFCTDLCIPTKKVKKYANQIIYTISESAFSKLVIIVIAFLA